MGRPRGDRGERITVTAARLFRERGFHATSVDDIAAAEGITGGAIYRHFAGKDDLLAAVALRGVSRVGQRLAAVDGGSLADVIRAGGQAVTCDLDSIMVFLRDGRLLDAERLRPIVAVSRANDDRMITAVRETRPELSRRHAGFLLQSISGMYLSLAHFHAGVPRGRIEDIWTVMGTAALLGAPSTPIDVGRSRDGATVGASRASRREAILGEATSLFRRHGFGGVGIDEIGAAAGIAGPSVYRHFGSKDELLAATMLRAGEQLAAGAATALTAPEPLTALVSSYVQIAIAHADTIAVYLAEVESLSPQRRRAVRRDQRAYVDEWQAVVERLAPSRSPDDSRVAVHAAVGLVNGYAEGRVRPPADTTAEALTAMTNAALAAFIT